MANSTHPPICNDGEIIGKIRIIRGQKVMLDRGLAELYGVTTFRLNEAVKRNIERFPEDCVFQLGIEEFKNLTSQFAISSWGGIRRPPFAFTEHGVAILSYVLRTKRAIEVSIRIIRVYIKIKQVLLDNKEIWQKMDKVERAFAKKMKKYRRFLIYLRNW